MRLIIQSEATGAFLCPGPQGGDVMWTRCLRDAGGGVFSDMDSAHQLIEDNCEYEDRPFVVDLDRLGTVNDYPPVIRPRPR